MIEGDDSPPWKIGGAKSLGFTETDGVIDDGSDDFYPADWKPEREAKEEKLEIVRVPPPIPERGKLVIVNKKTHTPTDNDFYCGRGSPLGNVFDFRGSNHPQVKYKVTSKEEAIACYELYLREKIKNKDPDICAALNQIYRMTSKGDVYLSCFCWPEACHVDVIRRVIEEKLKKD